MSKTGGDRSAPTLAEAGILIGVSRAAIPRIANGGALAAKATEPAAAGRGPVSPAGRMIRGSI